MEPKHLWVTDSVQRHFFSLETPSHKASQQGFNLAAASSYLSQPRLQLTSGLMHGLCWMSFRKDCLRSTVLADPTTADNLAQNLVCVNDCK